MKELIMVTGFKRAGKDTFGNYICENYGYKKAQPFACFKSSLKEWFDFSEEQMEGELKEVEDKRWGISPRELMQIFGTDLMKDCLSDLCPEYGKVTGRNIWSKVFRNWYLKQPDGKYVVCDWRFPEEYNVISDLPNITRIKIIKDNNSEDSHISESYVDSLHCEYGILNWTTLQDFYDNIDMTMELIDKSKNKR